MTVFVNGAEQELSDDATLAELLLAVGAPARGVAVAVDGTHIVRGEWVSTNLRGGEQVEILTAVQGG